MGAITIYHNPKCSKSRATLDLVADRGDVKIIEYLKTPPTAKELESLVAKLGIEPEQLVRKGEDVFKKPSDPDRAPDRRGRRPSGHRPAARERARAARRALRRAPRREPCVFARVSSPTSRAE